MNTKSTPNDDSLRQHPELSKRLKTEAEWAEFIDILDDKKVSFPNLDEESHIGFAYHIFEMRQIDRKIRRKGLAYIEPFIQAGFVTWDDLEGLNFNEVRSIIWQIRSSLPPEHVLRQRLVPQTKIPKPMKPEDNVAFPRFLTRQTALKWEAEWEAECERKRLEEERNERELAELHRMWGPHSERVK